MVDSESFLYIVTLITFASIGLMLYIKHILTFFNRIGITEIFTPIFPYGNIESYVQNVSTWCEQVDSFYRLSRLKKYKLCGIYIYVKPYVLLVDQNLVKKFLEDNQDNEKEDIHLYVKFKNVCKTSANWKEKVQGLCSPANNKLFYETIVRECGKVKEFLDATLKQEQYDLNDVLERYIIDVSAACILGIHSDTIINQESEFYKFTKALADQEIWQPSLKQQLLNDFAWLRKIFHSEDFNENELFRFFKTLINEVMEHRKENSLKRDDFLQLFLNEAEQNLQMDNITCHCLNAFIHNLIKCHSTLCLCLYELSVNKNIQRKLRNEITKVKVNQPSVDAALLNMPYLTQIIEETLRKYPPDATMVKTLKKDYNFPDLELTVPQGVGIIIPLYQIQHDPEYYLSPDDFTPERFSLESNKERLHYKEIFSKCSGYEFATVFLKILLMVLVESYEYSVDTVHDSSMFIENGSILRAKKLTCIKINKIL